MKDYEACYEEFWKDIVEKGGILNVDQIKKELFDFHRLITNTSRVYDYLTDGAVSKPLTDPSVVCSLVDEHYKEMYSEKNF